jgi:hypothetical protein
MNLTVAIIAERLLCGRPLVAKKNQGLDRTS